jgi:hypothetical protein
VDGIKGKGIDLIYFVGATYCASMNLIASFIYRLQLPCKRGGFGGKHFLMPTNAPLLGRSHHTSGFHGKEWSRASMQCALFVCRFTSHGGVHLLFHLTFNFL